MKPIHGLDEITRDELLRLADLYPKCAISGRGIEFLGGPRSECGFVPNDWDGKTVILERKR